MIKGKDVYEVLSALVPLYVAMVLGFGSVRWWKILTPEQCSGINRFVAAIAVPFLSFKLIASNNIYAMNLKFLAGDSLQKVVLLVALLLWNMTRFGSIDWTITIFSLFTMPTTLVMGVPILKAMYGDFSESLMVQIVVLQTCVWTTLLLFLFEYRGAKLRIQEQFPETAGSISTLEAEIGTIDPSKVVDVPHETAASKEAHELIVIEEKAPYPLSGSQKKVDIEEGNGDKKQQIPSASIFTRLILITVFKKLVRNPNIWASILGLTWSLIVFRFNIKMPTIIKGSVTIMSNTGMGMATFSLGVFMALQPKLIACGKKMAAISMAIRFLGGPAVIAACSAAIGIHGVLLQVEIVQAALPQAIVCFVFAKEYNLHADIFSTAAIFGMVVALPVTIIYYVLLGLLSFEGKQRN